MLTEYIHLRSNLISFFLYIISYTINFCARVIDIRLLRIDSSHGKLQLLTSFISFWGKFCCSLELLTLVIVNANFVSVDHDYVHIFDQQETNQRIVRFYFKHRFLFESTLCEEL